MFSATAEYYDKIYGFKDYEAEVEDLLQIIGEALGRQEGALLDVACGTGQHLRHLSKQFATEGLDLLPELLDIARRRNPGVEFHHADMTDFDLGRQFDAVTCLFSSIGYVRTVDRLHQAVSCMAAHLNSGGILAIEPWFTPDSWKPGTVHAVLVDEPELKIARVSTSMSEGRLSYFDMHYLIGTPRGTEHHVERHELGLFTTEEMTAALGQAGLAAMYDPAGLSGRGLYIGKRLA